MLLSGYLLHSSQALLSLASSLCGVASQQRSSLCLPTEPPQQPRVCTPLLLLGLENDGINQMPILQGLRSGLTSLSVGWGEISAPWRGTQEHSAMVKAGTIILATDSVKVTSPDFSALLEKGPRENPSSSSDTPVPTEISKVVLKRAGEQGSRPPRAAHCGVTGGERKSPFI